MTLISCPIINVQKDWIDYNGHMNMAYYNVVFDKGVDHMFDVLEAGAAYTKATNGSFFAMEVHVTYAEEVVLDDPLRVTVQLLDANDKCLHIFMQMFHAEKGYLAATLEQMSLHVDLRQRKAAPLPATISTNIQKVREAHDKLPKPPQVGSVIGIRRKKA